MTGYDEATERAGIDNWILDIPEPDGNWCERCDAVIDTDDMFEPACTCNPEDWVCEDCEAELSEVIVDEGCTKCEDCLCGYDDDDEDSECEGCIYCLCVRDYNEAKANGTLKTA